MKTCRHILAALIAALMIVPAMKAQNVTTPYSMYGYGILGDYATSMQRQMGGVGYAMNSGRQINVMNPASYASIDSLTFLFDMGVDVSILWSKENNIRESTVGGGLDYVTMQFPLGKHFGGSIGLLPYSSVGYAFGNQIEHGASENQGSGGINQAYVGVAANYFGIGIGANISYNFGNIVNDVYITPATSGRTLTEHVMEIRDWNINIGAQYTLKWNRYNKMVVGLTYSPKKSMHGNTWVTKQDVNLDARPDTVAQMKIGKNYYQPNTIGAGISFSHFRTYRVQAEIDFEYQDWANAKYSPLYDDAGQMAFAGMKFNNRYRVAAGAELTPKVRGNFFSTLTYRIGAHYTRDYLCILGNSMRDYGISCGFGIPTLEGKTLINLGLEWRHRTTSPTVLISENYFNITLGLNFNEMWFWKRRIK